MRKLCTFFLALIASAGIVKAAIIDGSCGANLNWSLNTQDSTLVISGTGDMTGWPTSSYVPWYEYRLYIKNVLLPEGITNIGENAFQGCTNLSSVTIPNSVTVIGVRAFWMCTGLKNVEIGKHVTDIKNYAFCYCTRLSYIEIPNSVINICRNAFEECYGLQTVIIGDNVETIGMEAFKRCNAMTSLTLGKSIQSIESRAFSQCSSLPSLIIPGSVSSMESNAFEECSNLVSLTILEGVSIVGDRAFTSCHALTSVEIPNSVTSIGMSAFYYCKNLSSIVIGDGVTSIGMWAFDACDKLTDLTIGSGIQSIGNDAIQASVKRLTIKASIPPSVTSEKVNRATCKLYVPAESIEAYSNAYWWEEFASIRAIGSGFFVKFLDWDGTILSSEEVEEGSAATPPSDPTREGYTFIGWDKDFSNITDDLVVTAQYKINRYKVVFVDWDDTILKSDSVDWNTAAIAPENPYRKGYTFIGWDKEFCNITENLVVTAQYELGENENFAINFNTENGDEILSNSVVLKVPVAPKIDGFTFIGWRPVPSIIEENVIELEAVYESDTPQSMPAEVSVPGNPAQKLIRNGNIYILTDSKTYTVTGQEVK